MQTNPCAASTSDEIRCLTQLIGLEATQQTDEVNAKAWLTTLPLVLHEKSSSHFLEQLALRTNTIDKLISAFGQGVGYTRTRMWAETCRIVSAGHIARLQNLETALALSTRAKWINTDNNKKPAPTASIQPSSNHS